jgi:hypothetical protein
VVTTEPPPLASVSNQVRTVIQDLETLPHASIILNVPSLRVAISPYRLDSVPVVNVASNARKRTALATSSDARSASLE